MTDRIYTAIVTITSVGDAPEVSVQLDWDPELDEQDPRVLGFTPASFKFVERLIIPVLERAYMEATSPEIFDESPSDKVH